MAASTAVKAFAFVLFIAAIGGAAYGVNVTLGDTIESHLVTVAAPRGSVNATPGHTVTYVVTVANRDTAAREVVVHVTGLARGDSAITTVRGAANTSVLVDVTLPASIPAGDHTLDVRVTDVNGRVLRERDGLLTLHVLPEGDGFAFGDAADLVYAGRLSATGRIFNTNDRGLVGLSLPKTDSYRFSEGLLHVVTTPRITVVQGLYEGMLGMQPNETRTISFPPEKGYGPSTDEITVARDDVLLRNVSLVNQEQTNISRETFDSYIEQSEQGRPQDYRVGSVFTLEQGGSLWPYRITNISDEAVDYRLAASVGDAFTLFPFWPNASVVTRIDDQLVAFRTTPTTGIGDKITIKQYWPQLSELVLLNETHMVVRNTPPVGFSYTHITSSGQPREATVKEVLDDRIVVALPSQNPLAGKDLTFDVTMVTLEKGAPAPSAAGTS